MDLVILASISVRSCLDVGDLNAFVWINYGNNSFSGDEECYEMYSNYECWHDLHKISIHSGLMSSCTYNHDNLHAFV